MQEGEQIPPSTSSMTSSSVHPASLSAIESKIEIGRSKKDAGDVAFKEGDVKSGESLYLVKFISDGFKHSTSGIP